MSEKLRVKDLYEGHFVTYVGYKGNSAKAKINKNNTLTEERRRIHRLAIVRELKLMMLTAVC